MDIERSKSETSPVFVAMVCVMVTALSKKLATFSKSSSVKPLKKNMNMRKRMHRHRKQKAVKLLYSTRLENVTLYSARAELCGIEDYLVVRAGVPILMPPGVMAETSPGMVF